MFTRIEALNYRCLRYVSQRLGAFNILVGPNGSGKSAFLDVPVLLGDFLRDGLDSAILIGRPGSGIGGRAGSIDELIFKQQSDRFELAVELQIPDNLTEELKKAGRSYNMARYEVALGKDESGELAVKNETLWIYSHGSNSVRRPVQVQRQLFPCEPQAPETLMTARGGQHSPAGWRKVVNKTSTGNDYFQSETGKWNNVFRIGPRKAALANLPEDERRFPVAIWLRNMLTQGVHRIAFETAAMRGACSPSLVRAFLPDGSNLPLLIEDLRKRSPQRFSEWIEHIRAFFQEIDDIQIVERKEDRHRYLDVKFGCGVSVPSWLLSDGTLRLLALTLSAYLTDESIVYLIEEPENGIHPRAIEAVFQSLDSIYQGQVFLATHSPMILGLADRSQMLCFGKNQSGSISVVNGMDHPALRDWKGQVSLSTLFAAGVLQ
jgi:predicted ATPase